MKSHEQRLQMLMQAKLKGLTMSKMAKDGLNCSTSWISQYFDNKCNFNLKSEEKLETFIEQYQAK